MLSAIGYLGCTSLFMIANMLFYTLHVHIYRKCFVSTDDTQTLRSFVRAASSSHPHLQCAKINDTLWGLYTLGLTKAYCQSAQSKVKKCVLHWTTARK